MHRRIGWYERHGFRQSCTAPLSNSRSTVAASYYEIADGVITFAHTEVPPELGGKGIGSKLIKGALDHARAEGLKVIAQCPFVKAYIEKHPEYADLLK